MEKFTSGPNSVLLARVVSRAGLFGSGLGSGLKLTKVSECGVLHVKIIFKYFHYIVIAEILDISGAGTGGRGELILCTFTKEARGAVLPDKTDDKEKSTGAIRNILMINVDCFGNQKSPF